MGELKFLEKYGGQSLEDLFAMERTHRVDSLVLAMESALGRKQARKKSKPLSAEERIILVVEALEREVNNGGYEQFFTNSSCVYAGEVEDALKRIGCAKQSGIAKRAVAALKLKGTLTPKAVEKALGAGGERLSERLGALDDAYYACDEPIEEKLFAFAKANRATIHLR